MVDHRSFLVFNPICNKLVLSSHATAYGKSVRDTHTLCDSGGFGEEVGAEARDVKLDWEHRALGHHLFLTNTIF